jgi:hypothetical protein
MASAMPDRRQVLRAMTDRRQVLRAMLLAAGGLVIPGCGVPSDGPPIIDGHGPPRDSGAAGALTQTPLGPETATDPQELVRRFLEVLSGKLDTDGRAQALTRAKLFLTRRAQQTWAPGQSITVVRSVGKMTQAVAPEGAYSLNGTFLPIGLISDRGTVDPPLVTKQIVAPFTVVVNTDPTRQANLLIDNLPDGLMLSELALRSWYAAHLVYFWDSDEVGLVPDLRYVPTSLASPLRDTEIVNWLIEGPSTWLQQAVTPLPTGTGLVGPFLTQSSDGRLTVNLSGVPPKTDLNKMMDQLRWSLWPQYFAPLNLQISSQPARVDGGSADYQTANLADRTHREPDPDSYCVAGAAVCSLHDPSVKLPVLNSPENSHVLLAAIGRGDTPLAALIREDHRLWLGRPGVTGEAPSYQQVTHGPTISQRPMWLDTRTPSVLVVGDDGGLYQVLLRVGLAAQMNPVPIGGISHLTAFSVAPDGRRIALVADGASWVAPLVRSGNSVSVGTVRNLNTGVGQPRSVAWTRLDRVVVAGGTNPYLLTEVSIDGTNPGQFGKAFSNPITQVVAYPFLPSGQVESGPVMVQIQTSEPGGAYLVSGASTIDPQGLRYEVPAKAGTTQPAKPANPFFVD